LQIYRNEFQATHLFQQLALVDDLTILKVALGVGCYSGNAREAMQRFYIEENDFFHADNFGLVSTCIALKSNIHVHTRFARDNSNDFLFSNLNDGQLNDLMGEDIPNRVANLPLNFGNNYIVEPIFYNRFIKVMLDNSHYTALLPKQRYSLDFQPARQVEITNFAVRVEDS
jgi:hypothetical protein